MGMGLNGNELGAGISQKPNGKYLARTRTKSGDRVSKVFSDLAEAKKWILKKKFGDSSDEKAFSPLMTLNAWFIYWIENLVVDARVNTVCSYKSKYNTWIGPVIGKMAMIDIKPLNCAEVLNKAKNAGRKQSTIDQIRIIMHIIFEYAVENQIISSNPVTKSTKITNKITMFQDARFLTRDEQKLFVSEAKNHKYYEQFAFVLQTGIRYGELTGLKWCDIDFSRRIMKIQRAAYYLEDYGEFIIGEPKSKHGYRDIYLTDEAIDILSGLSRDSEFIFADKGKPVKRSTYNMQLKRISKKIGIESFSIHKLRHTFATRCIESGMKPKTLQKILGHSDITITLNYYVHVTDNELADEMNRFARMAI